MPDPDLAPLALATLYEALPAASQLGLARLRQTVEDALVEGDSYRRLVAWVSDAPELRAFLATGGRIVAGRGGPPVEQMLFAATATQLVARMRREGWL